MKTVRIITLGCSKNTVDTEHLMAQLPSEDFAYVTEGYSDYLLINTCGFIGDAKEESVQTILEAVEAKSRGEIGQLVVFGCLSQRYADELPKEIPEVDAWFGARDLAPIVRFMGGRPSKGRILTNPGKGYAYIKVSEGCDRRCSYCAIPHIRGAHKSVPVEEIVAEAENLAANGVKELILIAQDTTYYGLDLYHRRALGEVLQRLSDIQGIEWIRIHYAYPDSFPEEVLDQMATNPKICRYLDIPLQHASDKVLDVMHRHVDGAWTRELVGRMRKKVPGVVLRTTMIVGHPGEGESEFNELLDFVKEARFERLGAFTYSEEDGTWGALNLTDDVPAEEKQRRYDALMSLQNEVSREFNLSRVGKIEKVMVDDIVSGMLICRSQYESPEVDGEILVPCLDNAPEIGSFIKVKITEADDYDLRAEIIL